MDRKIHQMLSSAASATASSYGILDSIPERCLSSRDLAPAREDAMKAA
jgi:hypothetical protein